MQLRIFPLICLFWCGCFSVTVADDVLIAHWPLISDGNDVSGNNLHAKAHHVTFESAKEGRAGGLFNGRNGWLEVAAHDRLELGDGDFSISAWVHTDRALADVPGDLLSQYDSAAKQGFHLGIKTNAGVTCSQSNYRQLQFGIDQNQGQSEWVDRGRPGNAMLAFALCSFHGDLYAATCEPGPEESGRVYRWQSGEQWLDCGALDGANSVTSLAEFNGQLYAGTGKYRLRGSALPESENETSGGRVFRYDGTNQWVDCGLLPNCEAVGGLVVYKGRLYASSLYRPAGFFRYEGEQTWTDCGVPERPQDTPGDTTHLRVEAMGVHDGWLYATSYDAGRVHRFDGTRWFDCGALEDNTQTYSFAVRRDRLHVGTWPSGKVYRMEVPFEWTDVGRLGQELEVMGMLTHNGRLVAGSLPLAEVYEYDGAAAWKRLAGLDHTPDVRYRRAWTMAEHAGQLFCSTLPSGKIYSWRAGRVAMSDIAFPSGWHHVAAIRQQGTLRLFVDGKSVGTESGFNPADFDLSGNQPLQIGFGPNAYFKGRLSDVRLYAAALTVDQIQELAKP